MTLSTAHRFLAQRRPQEAAKRIWTLSGQIQDWFFHSEFEGCLPLRRTLELWARQHGLAFSVVLTRRGELDFSGNLDPEAAERLFEAARQPRPARYGQRFEPGRGPSPQPPPAAEPGDAERATAAAAGQVGSAAGGDGQAIVNRIGQIAQLLASDCGCLVLIEDLPALITTLELPLPQGPVLGDIARRFAREDIHGHISHSNLLVLPTLNVESMSQLFPTDVYLNVEWLELKGPESPELQQALDRLSVRHEIEFADLPASAKLLERHGNLRVALGNVARAVHSESGGRVVTLDRLLALPPINEEGVERIKQQLDALVGLGEVKRKIRRIEQVARRLRSQLVDGSGQVPEETLHLVFTGSAGVGKTTVANIVAGLFHALGLLRRKDITKRTASEVESQFVGATGEMVQKILDGSRGGVFFLDEAHQFGKLENGEESRQAREAVNALVPMSYNFRHELVIILAGYAEAMPRFWAMDPGLASRFPEYGRLDFPDYTDDELLRILGHKARKEGYSLSEDLGPALLALIRRRSRKPNFGNARGVENIWAEIKERHVGLCGDGGSKEIVPGDLPPAIEPSSQHLQLGMAELDRLVGLAEVREQISGIVEEIGWAAQEQQNEPLHPGNMLFLGPPGTGKTTVARLLGNILFGLGILEKSSVTVADRGTLVGRYVGHTENNLREIFNRARGGVLLVDEAYQLRGRGDGADFGHNALEVLVSEVTKPENEGTLVVLAGYEEPLLDLLRVNDGLRRRFPREIRFSALSPADCAEVGRRDLERREFSWEPGVLEAIAEAAAREKQLLGPQFGNAGWVLNAFLPPVLRRMKRRSLAEFPSGDPGRRRVLLRDLESSAQTVARPGQAVDAAAAEPWNPAQDSRRLVTAASALRGQDLTGVAQAIQRSAFQVLVRGSREQAAAAGYASGFFVTGDGLFATCHHVVDGAREVAVLCGERRAPLRARVVASDETLDLAVLAVELNGSEPAPALPLGSSLNLAAPSELVVFGNAHVNPGEPGRVVLARVVRNDPANATQLESDGSIEAGFSGGPAVDPAQGAVIGIVHGGYGVSATLLIRSEGLASLLAGLGYQFGPAPEET